MKRSHAPSAQYEHKKIRLDLPEVIEINVEEEKGKKGRKKAPMPVVNHLLKYQIKKETTSNESSSTSNESSGEVIIKEETKKGKNSRMNPDSDPLYFLIKYKNTQKTEEDDGLGILQVSYDSAVIQSMEGRQIGRTGLTRSNEDDDEKREFQKVFIKKKEVYFQEDFGMNIGNKWIKIILSVSEEEYKNGSIFLKTDSIIQKKKEEKKEKKKLMLAAARRPKGFQVPVKGMEKAARLTKPLHNPLAPNSLVLYTPVDMTGENRIHVVVDPILSAKLRPHQREGVKFVFDCLLGFRGGFKGNGCILADDMGLGKSIQAITILWTLLKQGPKGEPTAKKAVIVAPCSLVGNWCKELKKWLGDGINTVAIGESTKTGRAKLSELEFGPADVLIISYDQLRIYCEDVCKISSIGLVICDEGHRLKNAEIKTTKAVSMIPTPRRVILSGTPIQNDLTEFYAMVNFVNPGLLKNVATFKNVYDAPIVASRSPEATEEERKIGRERSAELSRLTGQFILRRTAIVNTQYLPPKVEYVVFCKLTDLQKSIYRHLIKEAKDSCFASASGALPLITTLKKLSNCAELVYLPDKEAPTEVDKSVLSLFPKEWNPKVFQPQYSSKLLFVDRLLTKIRDSKSGDKVVIISNYTQTLEVLAIMCKTRGYAYFQLDGSTPNAKRQQLVDLYNDPKRPEFAFLLSSKAGGVGLNLIGGNHLVLFDADWNPANDAQSMARVWREGQKKVVSIYRTFTTGTIEEKIFQRQLTKQALSTSITEGDSENSPAFDTKDLKDIFNYREDTICDTHDMLSCKCAPSARIPKHKRDTLSINELNSWQHVFEMDKLKDPKVAAACQDIVSFVFVNDKGPADKNKKSNENVNKQLTTTTTTTATTPTNSPPQSSSSSKSSSNKQTKKKYESDSSDDDGYNSEDFSSDESYQSDDD
ncbi:hypothetical protein DICPUDRAFT_50468 [Dictyostelium purpureum]|uniref:SNF2-related domain-containing protein n=1 Tax=Dictyostelium purpureum TaxID=5786 RepID=F0ZYI7_DICPU|nr:uncharacterized protein DICPUDRAFT_50468 [Dictyostelium purpureum]EGC30980.1 hypothetical protein DICPUDRAFT_50468 [Dictyostelium purpureum]|eukprot:XP_003292481.1 hypothetical protein DICPUDRAFT_50468 [Dictyostelium purpureum]